MSGKNTLGLVVALVCVIGAYFAVTALDAKQERAAYEAKRLFQFEGDDVAHVVVSPAGREEVEAIRELGTAWDVKLPYDHIPANAIVWNRLAENIAKLTNERPIEGNTTAIQTYELETPHLALLVTTHGGEHHNVKIGALEPTQEYRYTLVDDEDIVLTPADAFHELNRSLDDLRDRRLFVAAEDGFDRLEFARFYQGGQEPDPTDPDAYEPEIGEESTVITLVKRGGEWHLVAPVQTKANQERVNALINEVQFAMGRNYIDDPEALSDYALDPPGARISLRADGDDALQTVLLGGATGEGEGKGIFVKHADNPSVFVIDAHVLTLIPESPSAFRENRFFSGEISSLEAIRYTHGETDITLTNQEGTGWRMTEPAVEDTDTTFVNQFLGFLKANGGVSFPESGNYGFDEPRTRIVFHHRGDAAPTEVLIGNPVPETEPIEYYVKQDDGSVATAPLEIVMALTVTPYHFRQKELLRFSPVQAREVRLSLGDDAYAFKKVGPTWAVTQPERHILDDQADMAAILDVLSKAKATKVVDPVPSSEVLGLENPTLTAEIDGADGATAGPLTIGNLAVAASRERFATMAGRDEIFLTGQKTIDDLREALKGVVPQP